MEKEVQEKAELQLPPPPPSLPIYGPSRDRRPYFEVVGAWTKAGIASCIHIKSQTDDVLLDCGVNEASTFSAKVVLISHGHIDHAGCCINHARGKALNSSPSVYYIPESIKEPLLQAKAAFEMMDDREIPMNLVVISPGQSIDISQYVRVQAFETHHRVPSQGYAIFKKWKGTLLPEYSNLPPSEVGKLKKSGVNVIGESFETVEVVYTGDTIFEALLSREIHYIFQASLFFIELTYIDGEREKALKWSHVHIDDIVDYSDVFKHVGSLIFVHLSQKYSFSRAVEVIRSRIPPPLLSKCQVSLRSFGASENLTTLSNSKWSLAHDRHPGWGWSDSRSKIPRNSYPRGGRTGRGGRYY